VSANGPEGRSVSKSPGGNPVRVRLSPRAPDSVGCGAHAAPGPLAFVETSQHPPPSRPATVAGTNSYKLRRGCTGCAVAIRDSAAPPEPVARGPAYAYPLHRHPTCSWLSRRTPADYV